MKKIFLTLITCTILLGCSKNEENTNPVSVNKNKMKEDLIGSWKLVGYYDDIDGDPETGTNYHLLENGEILKFNIDGTFENSLDTIYADGNFLVTVDSVLTLNFNPTATGNPSSTYINKINKLTDSELEFHCNQTDVMCDTYRYEKINQ